MEKLMKEEQVQHNTSDDTVHSFQDKISRLSKPLDKSQIRTRPGVKGKNGNADHDFSYVPWHIVANILDDSAPGWSHVIKSIQVIGELVVVVVALTIDGVSREGIGTGRASDETGIKKAEHDALKRAAVKFGVARELYDKDVAPSGSRSGGNSNFDLQRPPAEPKCHGNADRITPRQLNMIRALATELGISEEEEAKAHLNCPVEELNKKAASWLITYLQEQQRAGESAQQQTAVQNNVTSITSKSSRNVSPQIKGKLLLEDGNVAENPDGSYDVSDWIKAERYTFRVSLEGGVIKCGCGEYKTAAYKGDPSYECPHKAAVRLFNEG
jgi:hypothetical protein